MPRLQQIIHAFLLIMPVVLAGTLHMIAVKKDIFPKTKVPINEPLFGENKTVRGFLLMPLFTSLGMALLFLVNTYLPEAHKLSLGLLQSVQLGALVGLFYVIFELPNSYFKRRLGISPGKSPSRFKFFFRFLDRMDSTVGCLVVFYFYLKVPLDTICTVFVLGITVHAVMTNTLHAIGVRKERW